MSQYNRKRNATQSYSQAYSQRVKSARVTPKRRAKISSKTLNAAVNTRAVKLYFFQEAVNQALVANTGLHPVVEANDITTSQQPMGRDQLFAIYNKCYVKGCKVKSVVGCPSTVTKIHYMSWFDKIATDPTTLLDAVERCKSYGGKVETAYPGYAGTATGKGILTINPTAASTMNNVSVGATTALTGRFTTVTATTGNFVVGTSGQGVDFSATSGTGTSELLADYEEGTWTPGVGNQTVVGTFSSSGTYTKIGRQVTVRGYATSTGTIAGAAGTYFDNLPFASATDFPGGIGTNDGGSFARFFGLNASSNSLFIVSGYAAVAGVFFSCTYFV